LLNTLLYVTEKHDIDVGDIHAFDRIAAAIFSHFLDAADLDWHKRISDALRQAVSVIEAP